MNTLKSVPSGWRIVLQASPSWRDLRFFWDGQVEPTNWDEFAEMFKNNDQPFLSPVKKCVESAHGSLLPMTLKRDSK